jgi:hypothetical protein
MWELSLSAAKPRDRRIVSCASVKFFAIEQQYHSNEQECLAVVWTVTNNVALVWLKNFRDEYRWEMLLRRFHFTIECVPGSVNNLLDVLS